MFWGGKKKKRKSSDDDIDVMFDDLEIDFDTGIC